MEIIKDKLANLTLHQQTFFSGLDQDRQNEGDFHSGLHLKRMVTKQERDWEPLF